MLARLPSQFHDFASGFLHRFGRDEGRACKQGAPFLGVRACKAHHNRHFHL